MASTRGLGAPLVRGYYGKSVDFRGGLPVLDVSASSTTSYQCLSASNLTSFSSFIKRKKQTKISNTYTFFPSSGTGGINGGKISYVPSLEQAIMHVSYVLFS